MRRSAVVVSKQNFGLIGERPDHRDFKAAGFERKYAVIFEQYHGLICQGLRHRAMFRTVEFFFVDLRIWNHLRRIEHAQLHPRGEQSNERGINLALFQNAFFVGIHIRFVIVIVGDLCKEVYALVVHAASQ